MGSHSNPRGKPRKFWVIVEPENDRLLDALMTAYRGPAYRVVADRRQVQRRRSGRTGVNERRRRRPDVSPFAIVPSSDEE
ncbi:MAG TPA: hypothetical protein VM364_12240 [Vicinamibacterales bacterium]|nr:hypothetical protein [Vicinamibacterales bacterium]